MKRAWKIFWIIIAFVTGLGIIFSCIALGLGFTFSQIEELYPGGIGIVKNKTVTVWEDGWEDAGERRQGPSADAQKFNHVKNLKINVGACRVFIGQSDDEMTRVDTSGLDFGNSGKDISVKEENGVLTIEMWANGSVWDALSHLGRNHDYGILNIYLPDGSELESAELTFGAADIQINALNTQYMNMQIGTADCTVDALEADEAKISAGAGDLEIRGIVRGNLDVKCGAGSVDLELKGREKDFNYKIESGVGSIDIGESMEFEGIAVSKKIDNGSDKTMNLKCGAGEVEVSFY